MYYILYSYNKVNWEKENIKKITRKRTYIYGTIFNEKNAHVEWTSAVQTRVFKGHLTHKLPPSCRPL